MPFDESAYRRIPCNSDTPIIRMSATQAKTVDITLRDEGGNILDLNEFIPDLSVGDYTEQSHVLVGQSSSSSAVSELLSSSALGFTLQVKMAVGQWHDGNVDFTLTGKILDAPNGVVHYIEFMPNNFSTRSIGGPITVPEVRMDLMDMCPDANYLLDELEFTDAEVIHAMRKAVDLWNESNPPIGGYTYDSFPYRANWLKGTAAILLRMVAHKYRRNTLRYSAGGVTVADQERAEAYMRDANRLMEEYMQWVVDKKVSINMSLGYGRIGPTAYGRGYYGGGRI